ncbi:glycogen debranching N-terminal domain-containing protein [Brevundimonas sp.]|uniref:amylo-alpha-1,6-glucosidase n=1 Tax=Brevundimonas sp. TaxID=1871086 RepID=UPI002EDA065E
MSRHRKIAAGTGAAGQDNLADRSLVRLRVRPGANHVSSGRTVLATDDDGVLTPRLDRGLFVHETRLLSRYRYLIDGAAPQPVSASNVDQRSWLGYFIAPAPGGETEKERDPISGAAQEAVELRLSRYVGGGMHEDVDLTNFARWPVELELTLELESDFADSAETGGARRQRGRKTSVWTAADDSWELTTTYEATHRYAHQGDEGVARIRRGLGVRFSNATTPPRRKRDRIVFSVRLAPGERWHCCVDLTPRIEDEVFPPRYGCRSFVAPDNEYERRTAVFFDEATRFSSGESDTLAPVVVGALEQGKRDLAALRLFDLDTGDHAWTVAAGLPLYVALFGRDTLTAAWEAAPVTTSLMRGTLPVLAAHQGRVRDDWRDEQPGRMLHEAHTGPLAALNFTPQGRSYGSLTTSGFYPFVLAQLWHWTGDKAQVEPFLEPAIAALQWLDSCSDRDRDGFFDYRTRSAEGTENQGWKDSGDALVHADGSEAAKPIATCEEQGIAYAAKLNLAEVLWWFGRRDEAKRLADEATELKARFNTAFWMEDEGSFAMALDADGRQVRSIGSNALHCVATGIADKALVTRTLDRLFAADMFSGWGVRTLSSDHPSYNPYAYHRGTVWPVEHGPWAVGAYRYGLHDRVSQICRAQFETAALFDHYRLPECISGHARDVDHPFPAVYPAANAPQAWSATTTYTLLSALLGMQPYAPLRMLFIDPQLPPWLPEITLSGMRVADAVVSLRFFRRPDGRSDYEVLDKRGHLHVVRQPSPWSLTASFGERARDILAGLTH